MKSSVALPWSVVPNGTEVMLGSAAAELDGVEDVMISNPMPKRVRNIGRLVMVRFLQVVLEKELCRLFATGFFPSHPQRSDDEPEDCKKHKCDSKSFGIVSSDFELEDDDARYAGHSLWKYVADLYGITIASSEFADDGERFFFRF